MVTQIDVEQVVHGTLADAKLLGCARPEQLASCLEWLIEAQDELARAIEKARLGNERKAA